MSSAKFQKAVSIVNGLPKDGPIKPTQDQQLEFYSYYKQATVGDVNTSRPGTFDFTGKYKWDAWNGRKGMSKSDAEQAYVEALTKILKGSDDESAKKYLAELEAA